LKTRHFITICIVGLLAGYAGAEYLMPRYFHPTPETTIKEPQSFFEAIGLNKDYYRETVSGNYLAGQHAQSQKDWQKASEYIGNVLEQDKDNLSLQKHAMVLAMGAGEVNNAIDLSKQVLTHPEGKSDLLAILFSSVDAFHREDYIQAIDTLEQVEAQSVAAFIVPVLKIWADTSEGVLNIDILDDHSFYAYHAMLAANYLNKGNEATEYALNAFDSGEMDVRDLEKVADLFYHLGETDQASTIYKMLNDKGFGNDDVEKKIALLGDKTSIKDLIKIIDVTTPKEGAAIVYLDMAEILLREQSYDSAILFSRMALHLNSKLSRARTFIATALTRFEQYEDAISELEFIKKSDASYIESQRQIANLHTLLEEKEKAISILDQLYKTHDDLEALIQIGEIYRFDEEYKKAAKIYNKVLARWDDSTVPEEYWHVLYARGMANERLKKFESAEKDLLAALEFQPNHPFLLNYLGYSWADQGKNLDKSLDMIKRAVALQPNDGYIVDSLGWVYYKLADYKNAAKYLERAVELLPYDATINDHLGDAYWRNGRQVEAKFQWRRAVNYSDDKAEDGLKERVQQKLISGLGTVEEEEKKRKEQNSAAALNAKTASEAAPENESEDADKGTAPE
jgi:tetratricopeptide (TPR) repeat protein